MGFNSTRPTLYHLLSNLEIDLRSILDTYVSTVGPSCDLVPTEAFTKATLRAQSDGASDREVRVLTNILNYLEFGDLLQILRRHISTLPSELQDIFRDLHQQIDGLAPIRNRTMHGRPLEFDDLSKTLDAIESLTKSPLHWPALLKAKDDLANRPEMVFSMKIPETMEYSTIDHNLPLPDFDETGFIGRKDALGRLTTAINGVYPVITVVGEGGLGKTSLALKAAYEILDDKKSKFEQIIFVSAKTSQLTPTEIRRIEGAINSSIGLISKANEALSSNSNDPIADLIDLLERRRTLLILDNLETVVDENIIQLAQRIPAGSKLVITSRIGLGAYEFPIKLEGLTSPEASQLLRASAKVAGIRNLVSFPDKKLTRFTEKMRNNPLHIKWFVSTVGAGKRPEEILADERLFLKFCLSNVYEQLTPPAQTVVRTLLAVGGANTTSEISYISDLDENKTIRAIQELLKTNMFVANSTPVGGSFQTKYELSNLSRSYLSRFYPVKKDQQEQLIKAKRQLVSFGEQILAESRTNPLSPYLIHCRDKSDAVAAKHLGDCLRSTKSKDFDEAFKCLEKAKTLAPEFYEVARVEGWLFAQTGSLSEAADAYERAIELEPEAAHVRMFYGGLLMFSLHDTSAAVEQYREAAKLLPKNAEPKLEVARCNLYMKDYDEASRLLQEVKDIQPLSERLQRKLDDLQIQTFKRQVESFIKELAPIEAIATLELLRGHCETIPYIDPQMRRHISETTIFLFSIRQGCQDPAILKRIEDYSDWAFSLNPPKLTNSLGSAEDEMEAELLRVAAGHKFGFAKTEDGREAFIHHSQCHSFALSNCLPGDRLVLSLVADELGRFRGENVRRV